METFILGDPGAMENLAFVATKNSTSPKKSIFRSYSTLTALKRLLK